MNSSKYFLALFAAGLIAVAACGDDGTEPDPMVDASPDPQDLDVDIAFAANVGATAVGCGQNYTDIGTANSRVEIKDFRMFVSDVRLIDDGGNEVAVTLDQNTPFQHENVTLLDFEDGTAQCSESGTADTNLSVRGTVPAGTYDGIKFTLGVPFALNHQDSTTAPAPFNLGAMQWNWQGGYKYLRVDLLNENMAPDNAWNVHLGATGCESSGPTEPPAAECAKPNRAEIAIASFDPASDVVVADLASLLTGSDVSVNTMMTPPGCMSFPPDVTDCAMVFPNLGLSFDTGACESDCDGQVFFTAQAQQ